MSKRKWNKSMNTFLTAEVNRKYCRSSSLFLTCQSSIRSLRSADLRDIEGSSFNKAIELFNGTGSDIDLSNYSLELYSNGAVSPSQTLKLSGTLKNGEAYVLYHKDAKCRYQKQRRFSKHHGN